MQDNGQWSVTMETAGHSFSIDLLKYLGASTKTGKKGFAGNFGEGFKVCVVCLVKMGINISMESEDWKIVPETYPMEIDGHLFRMLGYRKSLRANDEMTRLVLSNVPRSYSRWLSEAMLNFYYPENPLYGQKIASGKEYAVYERSAMTVPTQNYLNIPGLLYYKYLARGILSFPLVFFIEGLHDSSFEGRDREPLAEYEVVRIITLASVRFNSMDSLRILKALRGFWSEVPKTGKNPDIYTWYYLICQLVRNIDKCSEAVAMFKAEYNGLVYIERHTDERTYNHKIEQAEHWYKDIYGHAELVNPIFRKLGAESVLKMYEEYVQNSAMKRPEGVQREMADVLEHTFAALRSCRDDGYEAPEMYISNNERKTSPMEYARKAGDRRKLGNEHMHYVLKRVVLKEDDFINGSFSSTFIKYVDWCLHVFGTDRSERLNMELTMMGARIGSNFDLYKKSEDKWNSLQRGLSEQKNLI